jgi:hypothetical protein
VTTDHRFPLTLRLLLWGVLLTVPACRTAQRLATPCARDQLNGRWRLAMVDPESVQTLTGSVEFTSSGGRTNLVAKSREGTGEIVDYPIEDLRLSADSIALVFAPVRYELHGLCHSRDSLSGDYAVKLFEGASSVHGTWTMTRAK